MPNHFSETKVYIYGIGFHKYIMNNIKGLNRVLKDKDVVIYKVAVYINNFVLLRIFYEGVACIIKSWDIIYR